MSSAVNTVSSGSFKLFYGYYQNRFLLTTIIWRQVKIKIGYNHCIDTLLDNLNNIKLATLLEESKTRGRVKAEYEFEVMSKEENKIMDALEIMNKETPSTRWIDLCYDIDKMLLKKDL